MRDPRKRSDCSGKASLVDPPAGKKVLLVEDNQNQRRMLFLAFKFKFPQHDLREAETACAALKLAAEYRPDVVLVDFGLPDMSGCDLCKRLRTESQLDGALFISLSGSDEPADYRRSEKSGFARHMAKPPDLDLLESWFYE